jgi:hypothetical protein
MRQHHRAGEFVQHVEAAQEIKEIQMHQKIFYERKQKRELRRQQLQQQQIIRQKSKRENNNNNNNDDEEEINPVLIGMKRGSGLSREEQLELDNETAVSHLMKIRTEARALFLNDGAADHLLARFEKRQKKNFDQSGSGRTSSFHHRSSSGRNNDDDDREAARNLLRPAVIVAVAPASKPNRSEVERTLEGKDQETFISAAAAVAAKKNKTQDQYLTEVNIHNSSNHNHQNDFTGDFLVHVQEENPNSNTAPPPRNM